MGTIKRKVITCWRSKKAIVNNVLSITSETFKLSIINFVIHTHI